MTVDVPQSLPPLQLHHLLGRIAVAGAVKSVSPDAVFLIPLVRHSVQLPPHRHLSVEGALEATDPRSLGCRPLELPDGSHVGRVVCRRQRVVALHALDNVVVQLHHPGYTSGMDGLETNSGQLRQGGEDP